MGASGSKRDVVKTKVLAVGRLSMVRKRNSEKKEKDDLVKKREQAMSVYDDSSDGEISREDITSLPLKNGCHLSDGGQSEGKDRLSVSGLWDESRKGRTGSIDGAPKFPLTLNDFKKVTRKRTLDEFEDLPFNIPFETDEKVSILYRSLQATKCL